MKFKAYVTDGGISLLEKRLLPALEKVGGKTCHIYLTLEHAFFLHNLLQNDAVQCIAQIHVHSLFSDYHISSNNSDLIAFSLDLSLLLRALRSASSISASAASDRRLQIKLVKKLPSNSTASSPFLTLETKGPFSAVVHDVPISKPLSRASLSELQSALDAAQDLPRTLVGVDGAELSRILSLAERMKLLGDSVDIFVGGSGGDLHLKVSNSLVSIGAEFKSLAVVGESGGGGSVQVGLKHLVKSLQCHLARPDSAFYGVGAHSGSLTVVFQFFAPGTRQTDRSISLHCRLPVLDPGT